MNLDIVEVEQNNAFVNVRSNQCEMLNEITKAVIITLGHLNQLEYHEKGQDFYYAHTIK